LTEALCQRHRELAPGTVLLREWNGQTYRVTVVDRAPGLVKAAVEGRLPRGIGIANLRDAPVEWSRQYERLGLAQP
jgi:hypothetical protein